MEDDSPPLDPMNEAFATAPPARRRPPSVMCGAKSKQSGQPCKRAPSIGRTRCKLHGGATPKRVTHGLRGGFNDAEKVAIAEVREQIRTNAADVIDDKAARLLVLVDRLYQRMCPDGTVVLERVATKEEITDRVRDANGELGEAQHVREVKRLTRRKVDVTQPLAEATVKLVKMLSESAAMRRQPAPPDETTIIIDRRVAARVIVDAFGDAGALPEPSDDVVERAHE